MDARSSSRAAPHASSTPAGGDYTLTLERPGTPRRAYRVTRTVGVRFKQFYVGVLTEGAPVRRNTREDEVVLPFGFWIHQRRWMPISYFDPHGDDVDANGHPSFDPWTPKDIAIEQVCAYCHNTIPYLYRFGDSRAALGFPPEDMVIDAPTLRGELAKLVELAGQDELPPPARARLPLQSALVTVGISCESCHFGTRAHAEDDHDYRFGPRSPHLRVRPAQDEAVRDEHKPWLVKGICRQCHSAEGSSYADGSSMTSSSEALELDGGACASAIACTNCHNPHVAGPKQEAGPDDPKHVAACTGCHEQYVDAVAARRHARHTPGQASCLDCHMPRITTGITRAVRSHRISIPGDPRMFAAGAPNACNLCHLDESPAWTLAEIERGWQRRVEPDPAWASAWGGSLDTAATDAWAESSSQATKVALIEALSRQHDAGSMALLLEQLADPAGMTRALAALAVERVWGRPLDPSELDITAPPARRTAQLEGLREQLSER